MIHLGMPVGHTTISRHLKPSARARGKPFVRIARIDDWAWRKGMTYVTMIVDLEQRGVVDLLGKTSTPPQVRVNSFVINCGKRLRNTIEMEAVWARSCFGKLDP